MNKAQIIDAVQYVKTLTPYRLLNAVKILASYYVSKWTKKNYHRGNPIAISIEPTTSCNLRCPECPSGLRSFSRPIGMLQPELNTTIIDQLKKELTYITYYFQGEPYLNKDFTDMVSYATKHNIYSATSTNAHYLTDENCKKTIESGLSRLIISIDGVKQESYGKYRIGGSLEKVIEGTKNIVKWKKEMGSKTPFIMWQFIVFGHNEGEIEEIRGVTVSRGTLDLLLDVGWIRLRGRRKTPGRPITFGTADAFLEHFGLENVGDLPGLDDLKAAGLLDANLPPNFVVPGPNEDLADDEDPYEDDPDQADLLEPLEDHDVNEPQD